MDEKVTCSRAASFWVIENTLAEELSQAEYGHTPKVKYKLNPLEYAVNPHMKYLEKYMIGSKKILFVGLNPGPWGMCQTGVPFGEVNHCKNFLGVEEVKLDNEKVKSCWISHRGCNIWCLR